LKLAIPKWLMVAAFSLAMLPGCHSAGTSSRQNPMTQSEALALAVQLANEECMRRFSVTPFEKSTYSIEFREGRWHWGELNVRGVGGYSAIVSFDQTGGDRQVEVFLSTDKVTPTQ
jgi:hypothetical protein